MNWLKQNPTDPIAVIAGGVLTILSTLNIPSQLGLTTDQVVGVLGGIAMIAATVRTVITAKKKPESA